MMKLAARLRRRPRDAASRPAFEAPRAFVTPEGVDLKLRIGSYGERAAAFAIDACIIGAALLCLTLLVIAAASRASWIAGGELILVVWLVGAFALRNFYFVFFELRTGAATPGKRLMGLRVAARNGGRLTADSIFARNAMRELEVFLPLMFLAARGEGVDAALIALGCVWSGVFLLFPLFNRDRLRLGDIAAGTMVIKAPKARLLSDLADNAPATLGGVRFTPAQLDAYGVKELHVLEQVLRAGDRRTMADVTRRIKAKIAWDGPEDIPDRSFLTAYYSGLRGRLEGGLLFGRRRKDKHDRS
jgi:uncharacterized RDD family membrane protein YckC